MEESRITIVGAGPAGLVLGLALSSQGVKSLILEKETAVTEDPRGVYLAADAVRILHALGLGKQMPIIGHEPYQVQSHRSSYSTKPFYTLDVTTDHLQQAVPTGILQVQPALEKALREHIANSKHCELRLGCDVQKISETEQGVELQYKVADGTLKRLQTTWLIGADGKRGAVRKTFLEGLAGIRQVDSDYQYTGTWIAANLHINLPTSETHPDFAPFAAGLSPEEAYDLFWPKGWHFCAPPGKPTAGGRFGPEESRFWRHEFAEEGIANDDLEGSERLLWEHLEPMITRTADSLGRPFRERSVWPRDTIDIMRCRPFTFTHKVVNHWYHKKTILIGDAAHVFPPFGGQGIASGIRDAHQLAWRIAMLEAKPQDSRIETNQVLSAWAEERTQSIKDAAALTRVNATLCNRQISPTFFSLAKLIEWAYQLFGARPYNPQTAAELTGFSNVTNAFALRKHKGGLRLPQIYLDSLFESGTLSDSIFEPTDSVLRLIVVVHGHAKSQFRQRDYEALLQKMRISETILSPASTIIMSQTPCKPDSIGDHTSRSARKFAPTAPRKLSPRQMRPGYSPTAIADRLGQRIQYVIVRPDFYVYAAAKDMEELAVCLEELKAWSG